MRKHTDNPGGHRDQSLPAVPLTIRVGFVGHRHIDEPIVAPLIAEAFGLLADTLQSLANQPTDLDAAESLQEAHALLGDGDATPRLTFFTGYAPGSDRAATDVWLRMRRTDPRLGATHVLFPFIDPDNPLDAAWTDTPGNGDSSTRIHIHSLSPSIFDAVTVLDGAATRAEIPPRNPHVEHGRWITRWSDVLVAVWNARPAAGPGGTADNVMLAMQRGIPILWIDTSAAAPILRWLTTDDFWAELSAGEILDCIADPTLRDRMAPRAPFANFALDVVDAFLPPASSRLARLDYATTDSQGLVPRSQLTSPLARVHGALNRLRCVLIATAWQRFSRALARATPAAGQPAPNAHPLLEAHAKAADEAATFSGNLHRGTQAAFLLAAVVSVVLGTLPAFFMKYPDVSHSIKHWSVPAEAILLTLVLVVWNMVFFATSHTRWSDCRRLAERLRCLRATWSLGFDVPDPQADRPQTWTEWQARAIRRAAGPPVGVMTASQMLADLALLRTDPNGIISGQSYYNTLTSRRLHILHEWLLRIEKTAFAFLLAFLVIYFVCDLMHWHIVHALAGPLVVASAVVPIVCAACLALDAKLGVEENYARSKRLAAIFSELDAEMAASESIFRREELVRDASRVLLSDVDGWRDAAVRRKIAAI